MEINLTLNFNEYSLDILKYFLLYFDKINVYIPFRTYNYETNCFTNITNNMNIFEQLNYLFNEKIISFQDKVDFSDNIFKNHSINDIGHIAKSRYQDMDSLLISFNGGHQNISKYRDDFYNAIDSGNYQITNNEPISFYLCCITNSFMKSCDIKKLFPQHYYFSLCHLFFTTLFNLYKSNNIATNCSFLNNFIFHYYQDIHGQNKETFINNYVAKECLKILLPNFTSLSIYDILEIKNRAKDELLELQSYIKYFSDGSLEFDLNTSEFNILSQDIQHKLNQSVDSFKRKCQNMKYDIAQKIIMDIKNPLSYSPLLLSLFKNIPAHIELFASLALISSDALFEYLKKSNELKNDPLYFTYKISKYIL